MQAPGGVVLNLEHNGFQIQRLLACFRSVYCTPRATFMVDLPTNFSVITEFPCNAKKSSLACQAHLQINFLLGGVKLLSSAQ